MSNIKTFAAIFAVSAVFGITATVSSVKPPPVEATNNTFAGFMSLEELNTDDYNSNLIVTGRLIRPGHGVSDVDSGVKGNEQKTKKPVNRSVHKPVNGGRGGSARLQPTATADNGVHRSVIDRGISDGALTDQQYWTKRNSYSHCMDHHKDYWRCWSWSARLGEPKGTTLRQAAERLAEYEAAKFNIDPDLFKALITQESGWNSRAKSRVGAYGFTQLMPATAKGLGVDPRNPYENLHGGAKYLGNLLKAMNWVRALSSYNAGPGVGKHGIPAYKETRGYVERITLDYFARKAESNG